MASTKSDNIILKGPDDWPKWEREFQKKAIATDLWDYIKGGNDCKALRTEPDMPEPDSFRAPPPPPAGSTRASASATPPALAGLNADEGRNYQFAWNIYVQRKKDYDTQRANVKSLKDWVTETIAQQYNTSSCPPTEGLHDWYKKLKEHASAGKSSDERTIREKYKKAVEILRKPPKDWNTWLSAWEEAMSEGKEKDLPEATKTNIWFDDFIKAVQHVAPQ